MEVLIEILRDIRDEIKDTNTELKEIKEITKVVCRDIDSIKGTGAYNSLSDISNKLEELAGQGCYNSLADICDKLDRLG